jgi:hypothetical protein
VNSNFVSDTLFGRYGPTSFSLEKIWLKCLYYVNQGFIDLLIDLELRL